jgi:hypothetical protein
MLLGQISRGGAFPFVKLYHTLNKRKAIKKIALTADILEAFQKVKGLICIKYLDFSMTVLKEDDMKYYIRAL